MPYRIRPDRDFCAEVRSIARQQLENAITELTERPGGVHRAIHECRKKFKRLRNLYRLVAHGQAQFRRAENARLRDAARSLSTLRDATALIETVDHLIGFVQSEEEASMLARARLALVARRDAMSDIETGLEDKVRAVVAECRAAVVALDSLSLPSKPHPSARILEKGWRKSLTRAHEALALCESQSHGEAFHDLRKAGQSYWMNLALLTDLWPGAMNALRNEAKQLVDLLGHEHDLSELTALLDREADLFGNGEDQSFLLAIIIRRQQDLRSQGQKQAQKVFSDTPHKEARRIKTLWRDAARNGHYPEPPPRAAPEP